MEENLLSVFKLLPLISYLFLPVFPARKINLSIPDTVGMTLMPCEGCRRKGLGSTLTGWGWGGYVVPLRAPGVHPC